MTEGLKPVIPGVITFGAGHFYVSQSDKGGLVFGGDIDGYNSYAQRGNLPVVEDVAEGGMAIMPMIGRARLLRSWGGIMDMSMDGSPFIDKTPIDGLYFNGGWCYGGFKATPPRGSATRISSPATPRTRWRRRCGSTASAAAISSTKRAWATSPTCIERRTTCGFIFPKILEMTTHWPRAAS